MSKKLKNLICMVVVLIMSVGILCACNKNYDDFRNPRNGEPEAGEFYTLQEAYDNGWLSIGDLRNIAYHRTGDGQREGFEPTPKNPEELSAEMELAIKECYASKRKGENESIETIIKRIRLTNYYGTYDGLIAVFIYDSADIVMDAISNQTIGGIKFSYPNLTHKIYVWKSIE